MNEGIQVRVTRELDQIHSKLRQIENLLRLIAEAKGIDIDEADLTRG